MLLDDAGRPARQGGKQASKLCDGGAIFRLSPADQFAGMRKMAVPQSNQPPLTTVPPARTDTNWKRHAGWIVLPLLGLSALFLILRALGFSTEQENGPMENVQVVFTFTGAILLFRASRQSEIGFRVLTRGLALLFFSLTVREIDVRSMMIPWLTTLMNGRGKIIWMGALWLVAGIWFCRHCGPALRACQIALRHPGGRIFLAGIATLVLANIVEKSGLFGSETTSMFAEELIELNGQWLMLLSAWLTYADQRQKRVETPSATSPH